MSYDFTKLSQVDINDAVDNSTYSLVVNGDEVQKTSYTNLLNKNYVDYSSDCEIYIDGHSGSTPIDYILTLTPTETSNGVLPNQGFIIYNNYYYLFIVFVNDATIDINNPVYWYEIKKSEIGGQILTCYTYNSLANNPIEIITKDLNGTDFITTVAFDNIDNISINNNADIGNNLSIGGGLSVNSGTELHNLDVYGNIQVSGQNGDTLINDQKIEFSDGYGDANIKYAGNDELLLFGHSNESQPIKVHGIDTPVSNNDAVNKKYVDDKDNALQTNLQLYVDDADHYIWNELSNRINSIVSQTSSNDKICVIKQEEFVWDDSRHLYRSDNGIATINAAETQVTFDLNTNYYPYEVAFIGAIYNKGSQDWYLVNEENINVGESTYLSMSVIKNVSYPSNWIETFIFSYLVIVDSISIPELTALRGPYDYSGTINDYSTSTTYHEGDYCYYPNSTNGRLYICTATTNGSWDSSDWQAVEARYSVEKGFDNRLRLDGQNSMSADLNMNSHKLVGVATPVNGTDGVNKNYVDSKSLTIDSNGILSWG